jgi:hypothetical protein
MSIHEVDEGAQEFKRGEGRTLTITTTNWASAPVADDITIKQLSTGDDVTSLFTSTATPTVNGDIITLPEIDIPAAQTLGIYELNAPFTADGYSPGIIVVYIEVVP